MTLLGKEGDRSQYTDLFYRTSLDLFNAVG